MLYNPATIPFTLGKVCGALHATLSLDNINTPVNPQLELYIENPHRLAMDILTGVDIVDGTADDVLDVDDLLDMFVLYTTLITRIDSGGHGDGSPVFARVDAIISKAERMVDRLINEIKDLQKLFPEDVAVANIVNILTPLRSESKIDNVLLTILLGTILDIFKYSLHKFGIVSYTFKDDAYQFVEYDASITPKLLFQPPKESNKDK